MGFSHDALTRRDRHPGVKSILPGDADKWLSSMAFNGTLLYMMAAVNYVPARWIHALPGRPETSRIEGHGRSISMD